MKVCLPDTIRNLPCSSTTGLTVPLRMRWTSLKICCARLTQEVIGSTTVEYQGGSYDFSQPFVRLSVFDAILQYNADISAEDLADEGKARDIAKGLGIVLKDSWGLGKVQIEIFEKTVEHLLDQPTFITRYPTEVSPLSRRNDDDPFVTDRFEFFYCRSRVGQWLLRVE